MNALVEELRAALWSVWNRRWIALAIAWGVCLSGWLAVAFIPNSYESRTRIFVQLDDVLAQQIGIGAGDRKRDIDRVRQTLVSAVNLEKVIRSTALGADVSSAQEMEIAVEKLTRDITVRSEGENLFEITATSGRSNLSDAENAQLAQGIAQKMIDLFREENLGGARGEMRETLDFLDQQLASRQKDLEIAEQRRLDFEALNPELVGGSQAIAQKLSATRSELRSLEADLSAAQSSLAALNGQIASTPRTIVVPGQTGGARGSLAQAEANLAALKARGLTDSHPDVVAQQRQIVNLQAMVRAGADGGTPNPAFASLQAILAERQSNVQALQARKAALQSEIMAVTADQASEPSVAAEATRISRDYEVLRNQYDKLLQDREELRLRGQVENERSAIKFEVIDPPTTPRSPAAPNRPLLLAAVLILGLGAGAGTAFGLGQLNSTFATAGRLARQYDLPVLGTISHVLAQGGQALRRRRARQFASGTAGLGAVFVVLLAAEFIQRGMV